MTCPVLVRGVEGEMIMHLRKLVSDLDAKQAAHENRIVACLQKRGPLRENDVKLYTGALRRVGQQVHQAAVDNLVAQGVILKRTTTRSNSFILELLEEPEEKQAKSVNVVPFSDTTHTQVPNPDTLKNRVF
jgi:hypothetical protein